MRIVSPQIMPESGVGLAMRGELLLPLDEACRRLSVGRTKAYQLIAEGKLTARRLGGRTMFEPAELDRFVASLPTVSGRAA